MKPKSGDTGVPTSAPCLDGSSKGYVKRNQITLSLCLMKLDKLGSDFRGDPASALLEVLDPEQNHSFTDNYIDVPFDLSKVMFVTTANQLHTIPPPLRDRMETIELPGYTANEKQIIAKQYLIPRQLTANGLEEDLMHIKDTAY